MSLVVFVVMVISRGPGVIGSFILIRVKILVGTRVMARVSIWISFVVNSSRPEDGLRCRQGVKPSLKLKNSN